MTLEYLLVSLLTNILTAVGLIYSFSKISNIRFKPNLINIIIIIISCILLCLNNYYNIFAFKIITALTITFIRELIIFKTSFKETFIITIMLSLLSILVEFSLLPLMAIKVENIDILNNELVLKTIYSIINVLIIIFIIKQNKIISFLKKIKTVINNFINFYTCSILLIILINIIVYIFGTNIRDIGVTIVILISVLLLLLCLNTIITDKYNNNVLKEKNKILQDEYKAYSNTIDECRELKHNLKNELYSIKAKLSKEDQVYINDIITKYNKNYEWINTLNDIPEGLQGLLYLKINEAKKSRIKVVLDIKAEVKTTKKDYINLCSIIGILVDNAIDASKVAKSKIILININEENNNLLIEIYNKYINDINTTKIGDKNYSTKEYKSGLGLNFIKKINQTKVKVKFKILNDLFITKVEYINKNTK